MEKIFYPTELGILLPVVFGFVLTLLPSLLGIMLLTKGTQKDPYLFHQRLPSPRWLIVLLGSACQVPAIIYILSLLHTQTFHLILGGSK